MFLCDELYEIGKDVNPENHKEIIGVMIKHMTNTYFNEVKKDIDNSEYRIKYIKARIMRINSNWNIAVKKINNIQDKMTISEDAFLLFIKGEFPEICKQVGIV